MEGFINPKFSFSNIDLFCVRKSIFNALDRDKKFLNGKLIDIGCGRMPYKSFILNESDVDEYIGVDIENLKDYHKHGKPDIYWDGIKIPVEHESFDCAIATEVLEHCPKPQDVLSEIFRVLKTNGVLFLTTPFLWNLHDVPHDEYRFTPFALERVLRDSGFEKIDIKSLGGWHASLAQMLGLWVKRSPMRKWQRKILLRIIKPIMQYLLRKDIGPNNQFEERQMITGLTAVAYKC